MQILVFFFKHFLLYWPFKKVGFICFNESPLNMTKNVFYFIVKALFILKIFKFFRAFFGDVGKRLDKRTNDSFKIYEIINWEVNNYNTHIAKYLKK